MRAATLTLPFLALAGGVGCYTPEAPDELNELSRYLYRSWEDEDERVQVAGLLNLEAILADAGLSTDAALNDRAWEIGQLEPDDVAAVDHPDRDLAAALGVAVAFESTWPAGCHAGMQAQADQLPVEPSASDYVRTFPDTDDPSCFVDGSCDVLVTENAVRRSNILFAASFELHKTFRWFDYETEDGDARRAFYSRSWLSESWPGDNGKGMMWQSFSVDVWIDRGDDTTWRYQTLWSETDIGIAVAPSTEIGTIKGSVDTAMAKGDIAIGELVCTDE